MITPVGTSPRRSGREGRVDLRVAVTASLTGALALVFSFVTYVFSDDHFGRISPGRQISRYGELPFRDFFDPGYFLTELSSAAMQRLFGDNLVGEMILTSSFVAAGAVAILLLVRRATGSLPLAVVTAVAAVLSFRRPYDYDKFLFYPLGLLACWRYIDTRSVRDLALTAAVAVVAGLFRYDNGLFIGASAVVAVAVVHLRDRPLLVRRLALLAGAAAIFAAPYALFLQMNGGLEDALDQMATYARHEGARTNVARLPSGILREFRIAPMPPPPPERVQVRWAPVDDQARAALESRYTLHGGVVHGDPADRIREYEIGNPSPDNLRALVNDAAVVDTGMIDRSRLTLLPQESRRLRVWRLIPFLGRFSLSWSSEGAAAASYYIVLVTALAAIGLLVRSRSADPQGDRARILSAAAFTLLTLALVMREPVIARIGGVIGPPAVLAAWLWHRSIRLRLTRAVVAVSVLATLAIATDWEWGIRRFERRIPIIETLAASSLEVPPPTSELPKPKVAGIVEYLRRCTRPDDRVYAGWFIPELYYFSQRAFAGGMAETFGGHWSDTGHQRRIVSKMESESVPVAILLSAGLDDFHQTYPVLGDYLSARYDEAGSLTFGDPDGTLYTLLTQRSRVPTGTDPVFSVPCFAAQP